MKRLHCVFVRAIFSLCLILLLAALDLPIAAQQTSNLAGQTTSPRPDADSIVMTVTVTDKNGRYVSGLDKSAFTIYDNKVPQEIGFFTAKDEPTSIGVIFDVSNSVVEHGREYLVAARDAFLRFIKLSNSENEYFVIGFTDRARLLVDWTHDGEVVEDGLSKLDLTSKKVSQTALYDACYLGIEKMQGRTYPKQAILLISDGLDNESRHTFTGLREQLRASGVLLYSIYISTTDPQSSLAMDGQAVMNELSSITGGMALLPDSKKKVEESFDRIGIELQHQYLLGFKLLSDKADGKWHQVKIKVTPPTTMLHISNPHARSREGYYATKNLR